MNSDDAWRHVAAHYAKPGIAQALLREQDEHGLDVVLHLFALYAREALGVSLDATALREAAALVRPWRAEVIRPLRALRRAMKQKPAPGAGGTVDGEVVRQLVKDAELLAERAELDALCEWLARRSG